MVLEIFAAAAVGVPRDRTPGEQHEARPSVGAGATTRVCAAMESPGIRPSASISNGFTSSNSDSHTAFARYGRPTSVTGNGAQVAPMSPA